MILANLPPGVRVIYADGLLDLAADLREKAAEARRIIGPDARADVLERTAEEIENAVENGACEWLSTRQAEHLTGTRAATWADRCRRRLAARKLAEKRGGHWHLRAKAITDVAA